MLELLKASWTTLLDVAELIVDSKIVVGCPFPGKLVWRAPAACVFRRAVIREQRNCIVCPDASVDHLLPEQLNLFGFVLFHLNEICLYEGDVPTCEQKLVRKFAGGHSALLVKGFATLFRDALHAGFDGDAARAAK